MNHEEAREVVQDFLREVIGQGNLGNQAFNALRNVNHVNLMSSDYEDQLMSFDELYTHLESYILLIDVVRHGLCSWWRDWLCLECEARQRQAWKRQLATNLMLISWLCRDLAEDSWGMSRISNQISNVLVQ